MPKGAMDHMSASPNLVTEPTFLQNGQAWTLTAGWIHTTNGNNGLIHSTGTTTVEQDIVNATHTTVTYDLQVWIEGRTAGSVTPKLGSGDTGVAITANGLTSRSAVMSTDTVLDFTPTSDFDGKIVAVSLEQTIPQP